MKRKIFGLNAAAVYGVDVATMRRKITQDDIAMIKLARTLNFKIIAEQVEDNAALEVARKMGVDFVQGYVIARPARLALAA